MLERCIIAAVLSVVCRMLSLKKPGYLLLLIPLCVSLLSGSSHADMATWGEEEVEVQKTEEQERESVESCPPCDPLECVSPYKCPAGVTLDRCGCCQVCARTEGEQCDSSGYERQYGECGDNLECKETEIVGESLCVCRETKMVCGSDGMTYSTPCGLNEESVRRSGSALFEALSMKYWGPCKKVPFIISPPTDTYGPIGSNLTLACEASGFPAPTITWQYDTAEGQTVSLPSDDQMISIQMRGGPEPMMVTGWAQIISLDPSYSGVYHCIASNSEGKVHARASVGVYSKEL